MAIPGVGASQQSYTQKPDYNYDFAGEFKKYADNLLATSLSGGNVGQAFGQQVINQTFDNLGEVGKIGKFLFNLFTSRLGAAKGDKTTVAAHNQAGQAALAERQQVVTDAAFQALADFTNGDTVLSLQDCKNAINTAVTTVQDKNLAKEKLEEQKATLEKENEEILKKIQEYGVTATKTKDGVEFTDSEGETTGTKKEGDDKKENPELTSLKNEYINNMTLIQAINAEILNIETVQVNESKNAEENTEEIETNKKQAESEILTNTEESIKSMRSEISGVYGQFKEIIGADEHMNKIMETTDKVLAASQAAAAIGAAFLNPSKAAELLKKSAENTIAATFNKMGEQLGIKGLGNLATGKLTVEDFATNLIKTEFSEQANKLLGEIVPEDFGETKAALVNSMTSGILGKKND